MSDPSACAGSYAQLITNAAGVRRRLEHGDQSFRSNVTHVSLTCGPDSSLNTSRKSRKHVDDDNLSAIVKTVQSLMIYKSADIITLEDVPGKHLGVVE